MTVSAATSPSSAAVGFRIDRLVIAILAATAIAKLWLVFAQNINWDEFYYLSQVHDWRRGTLDQALQTLHVHLFAWLTLLPGNEVLQIIAARVVYFGLHLATTALLYAIARRVFDRELALLCTFFYFSFSFVVDNATSFRTDGLAVLLVLAAVHLLLLPRRSWPHLVAAGTATALAAWLRSSRSSTCRSSASSCLRRLSRACPLGACCSKAWPMSAAPRSRSAPSTCCTARC